MTQPDVSFIIPSYNSENMLANAIRSALAQINISKEVIVVDDCSTDRSVEIASNFPDDRVRVFKHNQNRGPGAARNTALEHVNGKWVAILDSDDTQSPHRLENMLARATATNSEIVVDNLKVIDQLNDQTSVMFEETEWAKMKSIDLETYIMGNRLFSSNFNLGYLKPVIRSNFLSKVAVVYDEKLRIGEDYLFLSKAIALGGACAVDHNCGYQYLVRKGSISRVLEQNHIDAMKYADDNFFQSVRLTIGERRAYQARQKSIQRAEGFLKLVAAIKNRQIPKIVSTIIEHPSALWLLKYPILKRLRGFFKN